MSPRLTRYALVRSQVGFGDVAATTMNELICSITGMMAGAFVFAMIVGNLSDVSRRANPGRRKQSKKTAEMYAYLHERGVPPHLRKRITAWHGFQMQHRTALESEQLLCDMPVQLRDGAYRHQNTVNA